jgi:predicted TIM-barrel fold metal-dependent hydrolase
VTDNFSKAIGEVDVIDGVIDTDIHPHGVIETLEPLLPYVPDGWRRMLEPRSRQPLFTPLPGRGPRFADFLRVDATPPSGGQPGSDASYLATHHFDRHGIDVGLLLVLEPGRVNTWTNADEAAVIATAANRYLAEQYLSVDERFRLAMIVSPLDATLAAREIREFGETPGVAAVWLPLIQKLLGHRDFYPIYEAASELGLAVVLHPDGTEGDYVGCPEFAGGNPPSRHERASLHSQFGMSSLASLIFEGVFERFPNLKVVFTEYGWEWVAPLLWKMDANWKAGRWTVPWVKRSPTDYVLDHVRFTTQPVEAPNDRLAVQLLEMMHAERTVMYSSDYPHWNADEQPTSILRGASPELRRRIFRENAIETYGERLGIAEVVAR